MGVSAKYLHSIWLQQRSESIVEFTVFIQFWQQHQHKCEVILSLQIFHIYLVHINLYIYVCIIMHIFIYIPVC